METGRKKVRLGELLVNSGVLTNEQLQQALDNPARQGKKLGEFLVDEGIVSEDDLAKALSRQLDLDMIDLQSVNVDKEVLNLVPVNVLKKNKIFPFAYKENNFNVLMVAMADPLDYNAIDDINIITNYQVEPVVATTRSIMLAIDKYFGQEEVTEALAAYAKEKKLDVVEDIATEENINSSPIVMLVKDMIEKAVRQHFADIGHDENNHDVTYENSQARERTQILMDIANQNNGLVIGTGDLSELALGWSTYNGDHMSMYAVNASIPKTLVRYLVKYEADCSENELKNTLYDILDTPVSPELLPPDENGIISQKTEDLVGPYELHDFFLYYMVRFGFSPEKIFRIALLAFKGQYDENTILKWEKIFYKRFFSQQFKRSCLPDGPKIGSVALSPRSDFRMPSDASVNVWLSELENIN